MYHIPNDKRAYTSAEIIVKALEECLKRKSYDNTTISDICQPTTVSRPTFYRLFDNKDDVIAWKLDQFADRFHYENSGLDTKSIMKNFFSAWTAHSEVLDLIIQIHREDILYECHRKRSDLLHAFLKTELTDYHISVLTQVMIGLLTTWARTGKKETAEELVSILGKVLNDCSRQMS